MDFADLMVDVRSRVDSDVLVETFRYAALRRGFMLVEEDLPDRVAAVLAHHLIVVAGDAGQATLLAGFMGPEGLKCFLALASAQFVDDVCVGGPHADQCELWFQPLAFD